MDGYFFTKGALASIFAVVVSCKQVMRTNLYPNQRYLIEQVKKRKDIEAADFLVGLPEKEKDKVFGAIFDFAKEIGAKRISKTVIWMFFGGQQHFEKSYGEKNELVEKRDLAEENANTFLFSHMLLVVDITGVNGEKFSGVYRNNGREVIFRDLNLLNPGLKVEKGSKVLVHFSSILDISVPADLEKYLMDEQKNIRRFMQACEEIPEISAAKIRSFACAV